MNIKCTKPDSKESITESGLSIRINTRSNLKMFKFFVIIKNQNYYLRFLLTHKNSVLFPISPFLKCNTMYCKFKYEKTHDPLRS